MKAAGDHAALQWAQGKLALLASDGPILEVTLDLVLLEGICDESTPLNIDKSRFSDWVVLRAGKTEPLQLGEPACRKDDFGMGQQSIRLNNGGDADGFALPERLVRGMKVVWLKAKESKSTECFTAAELKDLGGPDAEGNDDGPRCTRFASADGRIVLQARARGAEGPEGPMKSPEWRWRKPFSSDWQPRCQDSQPLAALVDKEGAISVIHLGEWQSGSARPAYMTTTDKSGETTMGRVWRGFEAASCP